MYIKTIGSAIMKMFLYARLTVPSRLIIPIGTFIAASLIITKTNISLGIALPLASLIFADLAASVINSITDVDADKINKPYRPLANKFLPKKRTLLFLGILVAMAFGFATLMGPLFIGIVAARLVFEIFYSAMGGKKLFLINYLLVGITYCAIPLAAAIVFWTKALMAPGLFVFFFILTTFMAPLKDIEDYLGDRMQGRNTIPTAFGIKTTRRLIPILIFVPFLFVLPLVYANIRLLYPTVVSITFLVVLMPYFMKQKNFVDAGGQKNINKQVKTKFTVIATASGVIVEFIYATFSLVTIC